ncbi:hypothetical protein [Paenibacillus piri]|uniref:DUF4139 domain-containing protein n=1 Tax=Paenibacillus piri TaxID=2547395 RepID=A0A4R5KYJ6_9BACL|nr:hypothetical protein [Paenibacillus piri]TDG00306.1 hypothetical protein E1757_01285 [Paenibacillus piri]
MKRSWIRNFTKVAIGAALLLSVKAPLIASAEDVPAILKAADVYQLSTTIKAQVKSVLNEKAADGTRIGAVVRLFNSGTTVTRVPDYEVRMKTEGGVEYTLRPSTVNAAAIQPRETVELSYMIVVDRADDFSLRELSWADVDEFEYPRKESIVLTIPVSSLEWKGAQASADMTAARKWGEPFKIPVLSSALEYTPVNVIRQNTQQGLVNIVVLLVENKGSMKETLPGFTISGKTDKKMYSGSRLGQDSVSLDPGEKQLVYYAIPTENNVDLTSLTVMTPELFAESIQTNINYTVGRISIQLPANINLSGVMEQPEPYQTGKPIKFDPYNKLIRPEVNVSLVELHMHKAEGDGYKTVIAKYKLENRSENPLPVPGFTAELTGSDGHNYLGTRQSTAVQTLVPNLSYVISYSFNVPDSESGDRMIMKMMDSQSVAPYNVPIAVFQTSVQKEVDDQALPFYPFTVKLLDWSLGSSLLPSSSGLTYAYKLRLNLDIARLDNVVIDQNFSKMKVEIIDSQGRVLGAESTSFTGVSRLTSGWQTINFNSLRTEQFEYPLTVCLYESIDTPFGEAKRLVKTLKQ